MTKKQPDKFLKMADKALDLLYYNIVVHWSDGKKEVIEGIDYITNTKYVARKNPNARYVKYVELLKSPQAKVLYGSNPK